MTPEQISSLLFLAHWLVVAGLLLRVIMRRVPVGVAVAWLAVISTAPFVGAVLYLLMGERRLGRKRAERIEACLPGLRAWQAALRARYEDATADLDLRAEPLRRQAARVLGSPVLTGNELVLLDDVGQVFHALIADIDAAEESCHLCSYIWHEGGYADEVIDALVRAAERGVECLALADAVGSREFLSGSQVRRLRAAGVLVTTALPTGPLRAFFVRRDLRNHRKIIVIDQRIAYTGSQNMVDPRFFKQDAGVGEWVDAMARITGPAAAALDAVFLLDWSVETGVPLELPPAVLEEAPALGGHAQVVASGPELRPQAIHQLLLTAIYAAQSELVMTTPYFVPDEAILTALLSAAQRGVAVTLIVPARNDSLLVRFASVAHFDDLLSAGVTIALFDGGLLHTKSLTIDERICVIGSVNLDMRSLWLNFEISLFVYDAEFSQRLKNMQATYLENARSLDLATWRQRSALRRFTENAFRLLSPLL